MIDMTARRLASVIKQANPEQTASVPIMTYSLAILLNYVLTFVVSLGIGALLEQISGVILCLGGLIILRLLSGGYHFRSMTSCFIFTTSLVTLIPILTSRVDILPSLFYIMTIFSTLLLIFKAPTEMNDLFPTRMRIVLKMICVVIVTSNLWIDSEVLLMIFFVQSMSLLFERR